MEYKEIKEIIKDMENSKLSALSLEFPDGFKINMEKKIENQKTVEVPKPMPEPPAEPKHEYKEIKSPMVGTFYASSNPDKPPYVKIGDKISKGQVVCIVEAMKLMNEIESEFDGEVVEICVKDGETIGYGDPLFRIK